MEGRVWKIIVQTDIGTSEIRFRTVCEVLEATSTKTGGNENANKTNNARSPLRNRESPHKTGSSKSMVKRHVVSNSGSTNSQGDDGSCTFGMRKVNWGPGHTSKELGRGTMSAELLVKKGLVSRARSLAEEIAHACRLRWAYQLDSAH